MKTLVCVIGQLRAADSTWDSFAKNVTGALSADLAVSGDHDHDRGNPFWQNAVFRFTDPSHSGVAACFDDIQRAMMDGISPTPSWRQLLAVPGNWLGGIEPQECRAGAGAVVLYRKWRFLQHLAAGGLIDSYDRFVITRSDFLWLSPHCPLDILAAERIWVPAGEDHGGLNDRHAIVSRRHLKVYLDGLTPILTTPEKVLRAARLRAFWNVEGYLLWQLRQARLRDDVRRLAYTMALVRGRNDPPGWSPGLWDEKRRVYVKTPDEMQAAKENAIYFRTTADWRRHVGTACADDHVLRKLRLVPVSRRQALWHSSATTPRSGDPGPLAAGITVGIAAGRVLYPFLDHSSPVSARIRHHSPWHLTAVTTPERWFTSLGCLHYVMRGPYVLGMTNGHRFVFRRVGFRNYGGLMFRVLTFALRLAYGSLFRLVPLD